MILIKSEEGQAITELIVAGAAFVILLAALTLLGNYTLTRARLVLASRYAAWTAMRPLPPTQETISRHFLQGPATPSLDSLTMKRCPPRCPIVLLHSLRETFGGNLMRYITARQYAIRREATLTVSLVPAPFTLTESFVVDRDPWEGISGIEAGIAVAGVAPVK